MAKPLIPLVRSGGFYSSRRLTPLVYRGGFTRRGSEDFEPVEKTVSGAIVTVADALEMPAKSVIVAIEPVQAGSGDPSPENVRPITGWTGAEISHSGADTSDPDVISVAFPTKAGTVYGGTLDVVNGVLTVDRAGIVVSSATGELRNNGRSSITTRAFFIPSITKLPGLSGFISDRFAIVTQSDVVGKMTGRVASGAVEFHLPVTVPNSTAGVQNWFAENATQLVYELATPITYDLTPQEIAMFRGTNTLWANTGDTTLTYLADGN